MSAFQRFDLNGQAATPSEIARRWRDFHRAVRRHSPTAFARLLGPLLGDDTLRRRVAERLRPTPPAPVPRRADLVTSFPENYVARNVLTRSLPPLSDDVEFVVVNSSDPHELDEKFRAALTSSKEWLLIVRDADDCHEVAATLLAYGEGADVVYGDEIGDTPIIPLLKPPEIGPHSLLSYNVVGRPALLRRDVVARADGLRPDARRAAEHDLYLRLLEARATFRHAPLVLPGRTPSERHDATLSGDTRRVVHDALERRGVRAQVDATSRASVVTWTPQLEAWPTIDILIPTRDRVELLRQCVESVEASSYPNYSITILDNDSSEASTLTYLRSTPHRVVASPGPFNYAAIINRGVARCTGEYVVTLNNDTLVRTGDWLEQMVAVASLNDVSIVGVTLIDQHDTHEHDGIVIAPYPQHLRRGINYLVDDDFALARRDVAAVTGAVQMVSREQYVELGGMDEHLAVVMNDVDLCLRSQVKGRHVVMLPDVVLSHFAGSSRGRLDPVADRDYFVRRWDVFGALRDPYFPETLRLYGSTMEYHPVVSD